MEGIPIEPPRDLNHFLNLFKNGEHQSLDVSSNPTLKTYRSQHPGQDSDLQNWIEEHRILTKSSSPQSNGKGFDFMQEEDLKSVLRYLPKGSLLNCESFKRAVRCKQYFEDVYGCKSPRRNRGFDKYETESQVVGLVLKRNGFVDPESFKANPYSTDLLEIPEIFKRNLDIYLKKRVQGFETTSLKLTRVHFTITDKVKSEAIEQKTKQEIIDMISNLVNGMEVEEMESVKQLCSKSKTKQFLINTYQELLDGKLHEALDMNCDD